MKHRFVFASMFALLGLIPMACAEGPELQDRNQGPPGMGGFTPGMTTGSGQGAYGAGGPTGSSSSSSSSGQPADPPCINNNDLKRCDYTFTYTNAGVTNVKVVGTFNNWNDNDPNAVMTKNGDTFTKTISDLPWQGEVLYKFILVDTNMWIADPNNPLQVDDGFGGKNSKLLDLKCTEYTCADPTLAGAFDWRDAIMYFVFVDRFLDGDPSNNGQAINGVDAPVQYKGGDYAGVLQKINAGYFNDLGINTLWLTVPMNNPNVAGAGSDLHTYSAYHGYWPSDLSQTEEHFGTMADLKALVDAAHAKNLKVIVDYAMNHVHISSSVYTQNPGWFWPLNNNGKYCVCGEQCAWNNPVEAKQCWFRDYLPDFNFTVPEARKFSIDNAIWWIQQTNIDGFRLDAVKHIEDSWIFDLRNRLEADIESKTNQHFYTVGETFTGDRDLIKYYVDPASKLTGQFDFPLRVILTSTLLIQNQPMSDLANFFGSNDSFYGAGIMSTFIGNHDVPRSIHFAQDSPKWSDPWNGGNNGTENWSQTPALPSEVSAFERLGNAFSILYTSKGVPLVYYGDEIGLPGAGDPDNRRMMQWANYSQGQQKLLNHLKALGKIRADHEALRRGNRTVLSSNAETIAYQMVSGADSVVVLVNRADSQQSVGNIPAGAYTDLLTNSTQNGPSISVPARSSMILIPK